MSAQQVFRNTVIVLLTVLTAYIFVMSIRIIIVLWFAIIIASAIRPAVLWLQKRRLPQSVSILLMYGLLLLVAFGLFIVVLPPAVDRLSGYIENDDRLTAKLVAANRWAEYNLDNIFHPAEPVTLFSSDTIRSNVTSLVAGLKRSFPALAGEVGSLLGDTVLVLVIGVYWLTSRDAAVKFTLQLFSLARRGLVEKILLEIEGSLGAYVRGIALVVSFVGVANFILLTLFQVPNAVTLAFIVGVTTALPVIGGFIGAGVAVFLALVASPLAALLTLLSFVLVQQVETHYLTPRVMANSVHISPILVIIALFVGFSVGGVIGGLIAVPIAGTLMVLARYLVIEPKHEEIAAQRAQGGFLIGNGDPPPERPLSTEPKTSS